MYPLTPGSHASAPSTSPAAAPAKSEAAIIRDRCFEQFKKFPELTADEVAGFLNRSVLSIRPRVTELFKMGQIEDGGKRRANASGKNAVCWRVRGKELFA